MNHDRQRLTELYREVIITNAAQPVGHGRSIHASHAADGTNPLCGDRVTVRLQVRGERITDAAFDGDACAICLASASLLCANVPGHATHFVRDALSGFRTALSAAVAAESRESACPEFLVPLLGVRDYPARIACATLPWETALEALERPVQRNDW